MVDLVVYDLATDKYRARKVNCQATFIKNMLIDLINYTYRWTSVAIKVILLAVVYFPSGQGIYHNMQTILMRIFQFYQHVL